MTPGTMLGRPLSAIKRLRSSSQVPQFLRFAIVGAIGTAVHYTILIALVEGWRLDPVIATTIGFAVAATLGYLLHHHYTFKVRHKLGHGLTGYYFTVTMGLVVNGWIVAMLIRWGAPYMIAQVVGSSVVMLWNFFVSRAIAFRERK